MIPFKKIIFYMARQRSKLSTHRSRRESMPGILATYWLKNRRKQRKTEDETRFTSTALVLCVSCFELCLWLIAANPRILQASY